MPFTNEIGYHDITVMDEERNIILHQIKGGVDLDAAHAIEWHEQYIRFRCEMETIRRFEKDGQWKFDYRTKVLGLNIPDDFPETPHEILDTIKNILTTYAVKNNSRINSIEIEFPPYILQELSS